MAFDMSPDHGGGDGGEDRITAIVLDTMDAFDRKVSEGNLCEGCANRMLMEEALISIMVIAKSNGHGVAYVAKLVNESFMVALGTVIQMQDEGLI